LTHFEFDDYHYGKKKITSIGSGGTPIWWWEPRIHLSDRLIQMMMNDNAVTGISLLYFWDFERGG
jgi:hypothetical protein